MLKQSPKRNQKSPDFNFMYGFQIFLSLAISIWLLYQVKHFYDKAYTESSAKVPEMLQSGDVILKLGRKYMHIGIHGKIGQEIKGQGKNIPKDTAHSGKGGEDEESEETGQDRVEDEEPEDIEDLIDEDDKDVDEVSEELETEEKENDSKASER